MLWLSPALTAAIFHGLSLSHFPSQIHSPKIIHLSYQSGHITFFMSSLYGMPRSIIASLSLTFKLSTVFPLLSCVLIVYWISDHDFFSFSVKQGHSHSLAIISSRTPTWWQFSYPSNPTSDMKPPLNPHLHKCSSLYSPRVTLASFPVLSLLLTDIPSMM